MIKLYPVLSALLLTALLATGACAPAAQPSAPVSSSGLPSPSAAGIITTIDAGEAYDIIQSNQGNPDFVILDVRTPDEFNGGHISGAVNIDIYSADFQTRIERLDRDKTYLVYCRSANRSGQAAALMKDLGFKELYDLSGGIVQWTAEGYPSVKE